MNQKQTIIRYLKSQGVTMRFNLFGVPKISYCDQRETAEWLMSKMKVSKQEWNSVDLDSDIRMGTKAAVYPRLK